MTGFLTESQIEYIFYHLNHSCSLSEEVKQRMVYDRGDRSNRAGRVNEESGKIIFPLSAEALSREKILWVEQKAGEDPLPVLFPLGSATAFYNMQGDNLVFDHDLLKSSFYLLSGFQELEPGEPDALGRFAYASSIQKYLDITGKPLVNYYFWIIIEGIIAFCKLHKLPFGKRSPFRNFAFFPTHDVDSLDTYTLTEATYRVKQILGMAPTSDSRARSIRIALRYLFQSLNVFKRKNPHWDFETLRKVEEKHGFRSAFYFLPKDRLHVDAYYRLSETRVMELIASLQEAGCEVGIHGTVRSSTSLEALRSDLKELEKVTGQPVHGIRQHRLMFDRRQTHRIHQQAGLLYDTSLGFADHEGFRNSYCMPFRPYDHESDSLMDTWEIPLTLMDVTLFQYRKLSYPAALASVRELMEEVNKFSGVFVLLWHNGQNNEFLMPGMTDYYTQMMDILAEGEPENLLGPDIIKRLEHE